MLTGWLRSLRMLGGAAMCLAVLLCGASPALAAVPQPNCTMVDPKSQKCVLWADVPPSESDDPGPGAPPGPTGPRECLFDGAPIPCESESGFGTWSNGRNCYMSVADPQPPADDPAWQGHTDGTIYRCMILEPGIGQWFPTWAWVGPAEPVVDPADLAQDAVAQMEIRAGALGMNPPGSADRVSVVGLQTWLWVADPDEHTVGPITRAVTAGAVTVTATAHLDKIVWDMGDGTTTTCDGPGTAYDASYGGQDSPTCGHTYERSSAREPGEAYTATATSHWVVDWTGGGQTGRIELTVSNTTQVRVGEIQTLVTIDRS